VFLGEVLSVEVFPTENGAFLFSDYQVRPTQVIRATKGSKFVKGANVSVSRPGGQITVDGRQFSATHNVYPPLRIGATYLFFTEYLPKSRSYPTRSSELFELAEGRFFAKTRVYVADEDFYERGVEETKVLGWLRQVRCR